MKSDTRRYALWILAALGIHAALLFGPWRSLQQAAAYDVSPTPAIEVSIVESAPSEPVPMPAQPQADAAPLQTITPPPIPPPSPPEAVPPSEPAKPPEMPSEVEKPKLPARIELPRNTSKVKATPLPHRHASSSGNPASTPLVAGAQGGPNAKGSGSAEGTGNSSPGYLVNPHPPYPAESKAKHEQGSVMLAVSINERGVVTAISVSQSSGFPRLDQAARDGVSHWRFRPARVGGVAVPSHLAVPIRFRLSE